jgi:4-amino-4-deoxy-L-arabinose transferase-like glycosyltransferase
MATEREWREASDMQRATATLAAILIIATVLRFWGLGVGIPFAVGDDEPQIMNRSLHMMRTGDFHPHFFDYPGLYIYAQTATAVVRFLAGATAGEWHTLKQAPTEAFYLWGRAVTAILGTLTVGLVYLIGMRWGTRHALLAAALLAVMPLHVRESHFVLTDVPVTFFVTLTLLLSLRAHERPVASTFAIAGLTAGLAAATKYNGGLAIMLPLIAVWMTPAARPSRIMAALAAVGGAAAAFLLTAPYTLLDLPGFLDAYAQLTLSYRERPGFDLPIYTYIKHLQVAAGWPGFIAILCGLVFALVRAIKGPGRVRWTLALTFPVLYLWIVSQQALVYARYLMPAIPFLCVLAATAIVSGVSLLRRFSIPRFPRTALITALTVAVLLPPAWASVTFNRNNRAQTAADAYTWLKANVPGGSTVYVESNRLNLSMSQYKTKTLAQLRYMTIEDYRANHVDYVVASSQSFGPFLGDPQKFPQEYAQYRQLFRQMQEVARFTPPKGKPWPELIVYKVSP